MQIFRGLSHKTLEIFDFDLRCLKEKLWI
ncbi:hypothetical protein M5D96_010856 [Drosophila gunungcola]|uniref:Uncharacterized protein n=1 Tax=Drosophila gunungcola TaxID=103775 RepID=A0A9P9YGP0_9MUSC|nr:hypothetical protein M5D96_010856 [Drosophila gunungcola]